MKAPDPVGLALPHIAALHAYTPGMQPSGAGWVKLNTNENPYPPSPRVAQALIREIGPDGASLRLYPNPASSGLRAAIARHHGLEPDQVCVGNGSDDILNLIVRCYSAGRSGAVAFTVPSYSLYPVLVGMGDGRTETLEFTRDMSLPVEAIGACGACVLFLTSPNAPTGVGFSPGQIGAVLERFRGVLVVDEAYAPFAGQDAVGLLAGHRNLVVVRTLSKAYALAGLRVGYALAHPAVVGLLDRVRDSYNVNRLSQAAAVAALEDDAYLRSTVARIVETRQACIAAWTARGWFTYPSKANFIFTEPVDGRGRSGPEVARQAWDFLHSRKVLVRHFPSHALTASFLRITVGTRDEMNVLEHNLDAWQLQTKSA